jgi:predicted TIM-barrel fold metal-dependent hydrolase/tetratricopeptide (TPR) repeat protein
VAAQWAGSAHRFSSFNNPYYRVSVEQFRREKGRAASRFCGGCHEPSLVAGGAMDRAVDRTAAAAQAGVTCLVCHSITHVDLEGNGRYLADLRPVPAPGAASPSPHGQRLRPALLGEPRVCAACHKVGLGPEITGTRWLRGQNDYDAWHASAVAGNGAASVFRPAETRRCQDCHMPLEPAPLGDAAAHGGKIRSHRFLGANTALPHLRADATQEAAAVEFLRGKASLALIWSGRPDDPPLVDAVLRARGVGHRLPGGTMDSNELWLEVTALDPGGRPIGRSGGRGPDGALDRDTHLVRVQPVDRRGRPLLRRDPQHARGTIFDAALTPSDPQVVRYQLPAGTARVRARLLYRKFSAAYARLACAALPPPTRARCQDLPVVELAAAQLSAGAAPPDDPMLLVDWGLGLADATADEASLAEAPLQRAHRLAPTRPEPLLGLARLALRLGQTDEAVRRAAEATALAPTHPAPMLLATRALLDGYRFAEARPAAERLAARLPGDRIALALLARTRGLTGDAEGALAAADRLLDVDPESEEGHYQRSLALRELGRSTEAARALAAYETFRTEAETDLDLRNRWRSRQGGGADESQPCHTHVLVAQDAKNLRGVLTKSGKDRAMRPNVVLMNTSKLVPFPLSVLLALAACPQLGCSSDMTTTEPTDPGVQALLDRAKGKDRPIMDTHVHLFQVDRPGGVPWPEMDNMYLYKNSLPADYQAMAGPLGVLGSGIVEASPLVPDNQWVLDQIKGNPFFPFFVAQLEIGSPDFVKNLDELAKDSRVVGIRGFLWAPEITLDAKQLADLKELARRGMTLDIISRGDRGATPKNPKAKVEMLARAVPDLRIIIDHLAGAKGATPDPQWVADIKALAKNRNVYIKFSSFFDMFNPSPTGAENSPWTSPMDVSQYKAHFDVLMEAFGPDRLVWGSNYPVVGMGGTMKDEIAIAEQYLAPLGKETRDKVMFRNAVLFYRRVLPR